MLITHSSSPMGIGLGLGVREQSVSGVVPAPANLPIMAGLP
jgi:hypothetical protein